MKRKTSKTPTKIWSFGALQPTENEKLLLDQLFLSGRYYNQLIEIERKRREDFRAARAIVVPELGALEVEWIKLDEEYTQQLTAIPRPSKGKRVLTPELIVMRDRRKEISGRMKELRKAFAENPDATAQLKAIDDGAYLAVKEARAATDLYWGSYLMVEKAIEQARKSKLDPRFRGFRGEGRVGVQIQGGLTLAELTSGKDTRLQLVPRSSPSKVKKPKALHEIRIRIGSDGRAPIWATLPVIIHRPIPADAIVKWAWIKVTKRADVRRYDFQLTIESATFEEQAAGQGTVAINFGWRGNDDGSRRVAYTVDDSGKEEEFVVPEKIEKDLDFADRLRSYRDLAFEEAKRCVMAYAALHPKLIPEWFTEETKHITQWRTPKHLARVTTRLTEEALPDVETHAGRWKEQRLSAVPKQDLFAPATEIFEWFGKPGLASLAFYLELWRLKNLHLWRWEVGVRSKVTGYRTEIFRCAARRLADTYAEIRLEKFDLRPMAAKPALDEEAKHKGFRTARAAAAPGAFRALIVEVARGKVMETDAFHNTVTCFTCGHLNERVLTHRTACTGCGAEWDQDANNCRNQLRSERPGGDSKPGNNGGYPLWRNPDGSLKSGADDTSDGTVAAE